MVPGLLATFLRIMSRYLIELLAYKVGRHEGSCSRHMSQRHVAATIIGVLHTDGHVAGNV